MKFVFYFLVFSFLLITVTCNEFEKEYFMTSDNTRCALLSLSANLTVQYNTSDGTRFSEVTFENSDNLQSGLCGKYNSVFNISMNQNQTMMFNFQNINGQVVLINIAFTYYLPNINFPNATLKGTVIATRDVNTTLSLASQYYQCLSGLTYNLSNGVTFKVHKLKLKVFNVLNSTFGDDKSECQGDIPTTTMTTITSTASTTTTGTTEHLTSTLISTTSINTTPHITSEPIQTTNEITTMSTTTNTSMTTASIGSTTSVRTTPVPIGSTTSVRTTPVPIGSTTPLRSTAIPITSTVSPDGPKFEIRDGTTVCLLMQGEMTISVSYLVEKQSTTLFFPITANYNYSGNCNSTEDNIVLSNSDDIRVEFWFIKNDKQVIMKTLNITVVLSSNFSLGITREVKNMSIDFGSSYGVGFGKGYYCATNLSLGKDDIFLNVKKFKFEAFRDSNSTKFSEEVVQCSINNDPRVAIIVGIILAVFLIIVICLFIFFQIRAKRRQGYREI